MPRSSLWLLMLLPCLLAGNAPAAGPVGARSFKSGPIQVTADGRFVWVADAHADAVSRIDTASGTATSFSLPDPGTMDTPMGLAVTEDGSEVWVACQASDRLYVLDGATGVQKARVDLPWGSGPYSVALSRPDGTGRQRWAVVTLFRTGRLAAVDTATRAVHDLGAVRPAPHGIAFTEDGTSAWVTHLFVIDEHPFLDRVDLTGDVPHVATITNAFAATPRQSSQLKDDVAAHNVAEGGYLNFRGHPAQLPSSTGQNQLWLPTQYHNMGQDQFSPDSTIEASLRKLDLGTRRVLNDDKVILTAVNIHDPNKGDNNPPWLGYGWNATVSGLVDLGFATLAGKVHALLLAEQSNELVLMPWDTPLVKSKTSPDGPGLAELRVGDRPMGLAVSPVAPMAYVYNDFSFDVSVVDLTDPAHPSQLRRIALPPPLASDPLADPVKLKGARLFFTSADKRISANEKVSCASCHINGEHDGRSWALQNTPPGTAGQGHGPRVTIDLLGLGQTFKPGAHDPDTGFGLLHASGDRDEVQDFDYTFQGPMMGGTGFLGQRARPELGAANAGLDPDLDAMAAYLSAVPFLARGPGRAADGALTEAAVRGATFFLGQGDRPADAACATCHVPETAYQDGAFHDVGSRRPSPEKELNSAAHAACPWCASTPSLVGSWSRSHLRGTYGYASSTVDMLMDFRADSGRPRPHGALTRLTGRQVEDLAGFLHSIDRNLFTTAVRALRDTVPPRIERIAPTSPTRLEVWFSETVDERTASDPAAYRLTDTRTGAVVPVNQVLFDRTQGDRVTLVTHLAVAPGGTTYRLTPAGAILDRADSASGGAANALDLADPANAHTFTLGDTLTITLGPSGDENITVPVDDASTLGPNLATWGNDRAWLFDTNGSGSNVGFVRFNWRDAFIAATGVGSADDIVAASMSLLGIEGDAQAVELRRVLQPWRDPPGKNDYNQNPAGGPTWRDHAHPDGRWNKPGAQALGGGQGDQVGNYNGAYDLAEAVDAVGTLAAINTRWSVGGDRVTGAYRFWYQHPEVDYGYAFRLKGDAGVVKTVLFGGADQGHGEQGPVLTLTYRLAGAGAVTPPATPTPGEPAPTATRRLEVTRTPEPTGQGDRTRTPEPTRPPERTATPRPTDGPDRPWRRIYLPVARKFFPDFR